MAGSNSVWRVVILIGALFLTVLGRGGDGVGKGGFFLGGGQAAYGIENFSVRVWKQKG